MVERKECERLGLSKKKGGKSVKIMTSTWLGFPEDEGGYSYVQRELLVCWHALCWDFH